MQIDPKAKCANHGCFDTVCYSSVRKDGTKKWRPHCSHCQGASWGKHPHRTGVTPFKTGMCSNHEGRLGWACLTNWSAVEPTDTFITEIDHINGDHSDNRLENLQELCVACHKKKSKQENNYRGHRYKYKSLNTESGVDYEQRIDSLDHQPEHSSTITAISIE
jgi:5-methylcytosine-specific restriction endonuclease McrA